MAQRVVAALEGGGVPCWIAPRDIDPGESYTRAILDGLEAAPALVLVFSAATNDSPHVTRELESAVGSGIPIVPVRLEPVEPSRDLRYFIGTSQWLETGGVAAAQWESPLVRAVRRAVGQAGDRQPLPGPGPGPTTWDEPPPVRGGDETGRRRWPWAVAGIAAAAAVAVVVGVLLSGSDDDPPGDGQGSDGSQSARGAVPEGRAGMASVFPSMTDECQEIDPAVEAKSEVYLCRTDTYLVRYSRWDDDYDRMGFLDSFTGVASTAWTVRGADAGKQWKYESDGDPNPYRWSATYADLPFSVDVEAASAGARGVGIAAVEPTAPGGAGS
jgi:hypothetical protein